MYKAVIWDLDGTLLDTTRGVTEAIRTTLNQLELQIPLGVSLKEFVGPPMQESFQKYYGMRAEDALIAANIFRDNYRETVLHANPYNGIMQLLEKIYMSNVLMAVATNKSYDNASILMQKTGISNFCNCTIGSDRAGRLKKKDLIEYCIKELAIESYQAIYVGDSIADYDAANAAKVSFIGVSYGFGFKTLKEIETINCLAGADSVSNLECVLLEILHIH